MSIYKGKCWECENCHHIDNQKPWNCPACGQEVCESCFNRYMLCRQCTHGLTDLECKVLAKKHGYDFDEDKEE